MIRRARQPALFFPDRHSQVGPQFLVSGDSPGLKGSSAVMVSWRCSLWFQSLGLCSAGVHMLCLTVLCHRVLRHEKPGRVCGRSPNHADQRALGSGMGNRGPSVLSLGRPGQRLWASHRVHILHEGATAAWG